MDADSDQLMQELSAAGEALRKTEPATREERDALATALRQFHHVVDLLGARGVLKPGDLRLLKKINAVSARVQLATYTNKHEVTGFDIDCESLVHLCKARCCSFTVLLAKEDVLEGRLRWKLDEPYVLERSPDGYCNHLEPDGGCGCYGARPAICRSYDCRDDRRVWLDWEAKVPAPLPSWLQRAQESTAHDPDRRSPGSEPGTDDR